MEIGGYEKTTTKTLDEIFQFLSNIWPDYVYDIEESDYFVYENEHFRGLVDEYGVADDLSDKVIYLIDKDSLRYVITGSEEHPICFLL